MVDQVSNDQAQSTPDNPNSLHGPNEEDAPVTAPTAEAIKGAITLAPNEAQEKDKLDAGETSSLMGLPPELRLQIYEFILYSEFQDNCHNVRLGLCRRCVLRHVKAVLKLVNTSEQLRAEALPACTKVATEIETALKKEILELGDSLELGGSYAKIKGFVNCVRYRFLKHRYRIIRDLKTSLQPVEEDRVQELSRCLEFNLTRDIGY